MGRRMRVAVCGLALMLTCIALSLITPGVGQVVPRTATGAQPPDPLEVAGEANYVGTTKCAACHYAQFKDWRETPHGRAYEILPTKYRNDARCLECHSTGHGQPVSSPDAAAANRQGVSCEACHGPGGKHARYALTFVGEGRELTDEALQVLRSQIERFSMNQCVHCHTMMAHKPHPPYDPEPAAAPARGVRTGQQEPAGGSFFRVHE